MSSTTIEKKALKGFCGARLWEVKENTAASYVVGKQFPLPHGQSLTKDTTKEEYTVYADDGIYDTGTEYKYEDLTVGLAELPPDVEAKLQGSKYNEETGVYTFATTDVAPEYALGYAAKQLSGKYRMFVHYDVKLMSVKVDHNSRGSNNDIQPYTLTFRNMQRNKDGAVRDQKDSEDKTYTWLETALEEFEEQSGTQSASQPVSQPEQEA